MRASIIAGREGCTPHIFWLRYAFDLLRRLFASTPR
jgi:hypothetical protein